MYTAYILKLNNQPVTRLQLAKWALTYSNYTTIPQSLKIADDLLAGNAWEPEEAKMRFGFEKDFIDVQTVNRFRSPEEEAEYERHRLRIKLHAQFAELLKLGAAGDAEAAIKYCQLELSGAICHAAYA